MNTKRTKRWNGQIETLTADYLNDVIGQMTTYGDRVQFALTGTGARPHYQVINAADKKMAFDSNNHLLHPADDEFSGSNATAVIGLDKLKAILAGSGAKAASGPRASRSRSTGGSTTAAGRIQDQIDTDKYAYFKNNRQTLPAAIGEYSDEISGLMKKGMSAEDAFNDVVKRHF